MSRRSEVGGALGHLQELRLFIPDLHLQHQVYHPQRARQRRPHLVAHVGEKLALCQSGSFGSLLRRTELLIRLHQSAGPFLHDPFEKVVVRPEIGFSFVFGFNLR